jgi:hypothetical protein
MFQPWRIKLREAQTALRSGRLDEAGRLLRQTELQQYQPAQKLSAQVAQRMVRRGRQHLAQCDTSAGWHDLELACHLAGETDEVTKLRGQLVERAVAEIERYLSADDPDAAMDRIKRLKSRGLDSSRLRALGQIAQRLHQARTHAERGELAEAEKAAAAALALRPDWKVLRGHEQSYSQKAARGRKITQALHKALSEQKWPTVLNAAEALLEMSPQSAMALDARRRAWQAVGSDVEASPPHGEKAARRAAWRKSTSAGLRAPKVDTVGIPNTESRFVLWIDAVGGFLVCLGDEILLGQPVPGSALDVPIHGDLSRRHAKIRRDGETYLLDPLRETRVDGREVKQLTELADGALIELGQSVQLRFRKPHPLSGTARLDFESHHRSHPGTDSVLLMADTCVLGSKANSHVVCRDWSEEVMLFRQGDDLSCRSKQPFEIDGRPTQGRGPMTHNSQVTGDQFSLSLEAV